MKNKNAGRKNSIIACAGVHSGAGLLLPVISERGIAVLSITLLVMYVGILVYNAWLGVNIWWYVPVIPLFFALRIWGYYRSVSLMLKRDRDLQGEDITVQTVVTDDYIQTSASVGGTTQMKFNKFRKVEQTKKLILLRSRASMIYIFRKDGFTKGTKEEFPAFLRGKGIKAK